MFFANPEASVMHGDRTSSREIMKYPISNPDSFCNSVI
jgi:hypothetical protein